MWLLCGNTREDILKSLISCQYSSSLCSTDKRTEDKYRFEMTRGKMMTIYFGLNFPVSKLDYGISLQALEIAAWNVFKKPLPKYEIIVFVSYFYFVLGGGGSLWWRKWGNDASIARTQYWTLFIKCFHRMGKHETRNCDKCGQILTLEHVL